MMVHAHPVNKTLTRDTQTNTRGHNSIRLLLPRGTYVKLTDADENSPLARFFALNWKKSIEVLQ
jgi:hypothetical protein